MEVNEGHQQRVPGKHQDQKTAPRMETTAEGMVMEKTSRRSRAGGPESKGSHGGVGDGCSGSECSPQGPRRKGMRPMDGFPRLRGAWFVLRRNPSMMLTDESSEIGQFEKFRG